jgi:catechol 2,3-dioxygenase-like lactoylglutathione lyase family enzyme
MMRIAYALLWVHEQDEALAFYTEKLGTSPWSGRFGDGSPASLCPKWGGDSQSFWPI